jgi:hypothetical protein
MNRQHNEAVASKSGTTRIHALCSHSCTSSMGRWFGRVHELQVSSLIALKGWGSSRKLTRFEPTSVCRSYPVLVACSKRACSGHFLSQNLGNVIHEASILLLSTKVHPHPSDGASQTRLEALGTPQFKRTSHRQWLPIACVTGAKIVHIDMHDLQ